MQPDFADTDFPPPATGKVVPFGTAPRRPAPVPFPAQPYTRTPSPEAAAERRLMRYRLEAARTAHIVREAHADGVATGHEQGWREASGVYLALGIVIGLAVGMALGTGYFGLPL